MARTKLPEITAEQSRLALLRGRIEMANGAESAIYDRTVDALIITMKSGAIATIPRRLIPYIPPDATPDQMSEVEVTPLCSGLHFETLDADFSIRGLIREVFGINHENRIAGATKSPARTAASRANGKKGGRPRRDGTA